MVRSGTWDKQCSAGQGIAAAAAAVVVVAVATAEDPLDFGRVVQLACAYLDFFQ